MNNSNISCLKLRPESRSKINIYDERKSVVTVIDCFPNEIPIAFNVSFYNKKNIETKELTLKQLEIEIIQNKNSKMIIIETKEYKEYIYGVLGKISKNKGFCSPFIEEPNCIVYFPMLRYSDLGLIKYFCDQRKMKNYRLLIASC